MSYERQFIVGRTYLTVEGKRVKIIAEAGIKGYGNWVQGDDGVTCVEEVIGTPGVYEITEGNTLGWRYDRKGDVGRCTGSERGPRDLVPGSVQDELE